MSETNTVEEKEYPKNYLFSYAFCGTDVIFMQKLKNLSEIAEPEIWDFKDSPEYKEFSVLRKYILGTFQRCYDQNLILESENKHYSCFNTGLLTPNGNDIIGLFEKNYRSDGQKWFLSGFFDKCEREIMNNFAELPNLPTYTENYEDYYFNPNYNIVINADHILDDNWSRIERELGLDKSMVRALLKGVIEETKLRLKRNSRLAVPQFYFNKIMYLIPIKFPISDAKEVTMALAVEKTATKQYRANTIFTKDMAYEKARLLMKPESNWLVEWEKQVKRPAFLMYHKK